VTRHFPRQLAWACGLVMAAAFLPVSGRAAKPALRQITTIATIAVPASAFDLVTGQAEVTVPGGIVMQVDSSSSWKMQVRATSATFTYLTAPGTGKPKPVAELQLRPAGGGTASVISTSYRTITSSSKTTGWDDYAFDLILQVTSADAGGLYSVTLEFNVY
jgi:hypothetical protein